jgi:ABC-type sugar transport system ATPase subunit
VKCIVGLLEPSEGQILFHGRSVLDDLPGFQRRLEVVERACLRVIILAATSCC